MEIKLPQPERLKAIVMNGNGHAFDTRTGRSYSVNTTAQVAMLMMLDGKPRDEIVASLSETFAQPIAVVEAGIDHFIEQMARYVS